MGLSKPKIKKKKKSSQNHCAVEVSLGKLVNVFSNRTEKVDLTTLTITLNEKKKSSGKVSGFFGTVIVCFVYFCHMASSLSQEEEKKN